MATPRLKGPPPAPTSAGSQAAQILAEFPAYPSADDLIDLWERNLQLKNPEIDAFLRRRSAERFPQRS